VEKYALSLTSPLDDQGARKMTKDRGCPRPCGLKKTNWGDRDLESGNLSKCRQPWTLVVDEQAPNDFGKRRRRGRRAVARKDTGWMELA